MNKVFLCGNLGQDPKLGVQKDFNVCNISVATNYKRKDKTVTTWHNVTCFNQKAEFIATYGHKGDVVLVEGYIDNQKYTDKKTNEERTATKIIADSIRIVSSKAPRAEKPSEARENSEPTGFDPDEDCPF
jgi:single-strand DNA-binding protein